MELVLDTLYTEDGDDGGTEYVIWKWRPVTGTSGDEGVR
jgi:hypothetical protein